MRTAPVCGCETPGKVVRGMCKVHYDRWVQATPKDQRPPAPRTVRGFDDFVVVRSSGCHEWVGPRDRKGYGRWAANGVKGLAHRFALAQVVPEPQPGMMACHHCDNPPCVNPAHLYWGTAADNTRDYVERIGVHNKGKHRERCRKGHAMEGDNVRVVRGVWVCRTCDNERSKLKQRKIREARRALAC